MIVVIICFIEVINGNVLLLCWGMIGEKCDVVCGNNVLIKIVFIVCLFFGDWDKDIFVLCSEYVEISNCLIFFIYLNRKILCKNRYIVCYFVLM